MTFRDAAPLVQYEVDAIDRLVRVNDAWSSFATANGGLHLVAHRVIGRSLWEFVTGETTRQVYKSLLRRVRDGGRSCFAYRCDGPQRQRHMEMTLIGTGGGHVRFESRTLLVECAPRIPAAAGAAPDEAPLRCPWCGTPPLSAPRRAGGMPQHPGRAVSPAPFEICLSCIERVLRSVHYDRSLARPAGVRLYG